MLLLIYPACSVLTIHFVPWARPYASCLMGLGSILMTCQVMWHWDRHVAQFKEGIVEHQPFLRDMNACGLTTAVPDSANALYRSLYGLAFGTSGLDFLDTATLFVIMFQHCVQSTFLCRSSIKCTSVVSIVQAAVFALWPFVSPGIYPAWLCRLVATGLWTARLIHSSYVFQSALKQEVRLCQCRCLSCLSV